MKNEWLLVSLRIPSEIKSFIEQAFLLTEIRRKIGDEKGIVFIIHTNEKNHARPHIHAEYGEYSISVSLDEQPEILAGNLPKRQQRFVVNWVADNRTKLLKDWSDIAVSAISHTTKSLLDRNDRQERRF